MDWSPSAQTLFVYWRRTILRYNIDTFDIGKPRLSSSVVSLRLPGSQVDRLLTVQHQSVPGRGPVYLDLLVVIPVQLLDRLSFFAVHCVELGPDFGCSQLN